MKKLLLGLAALAAWYFIGGLIFIVSLPIVLTYAAFYAYAKVMDYWDDHKAKR